MSELSLFLFGCLVSLIVLAAVALLVWGAAVEPDEAPRLGADSRQHRRRVAISPGSRRAGLFPAPSRVHFDHVRNRVRLDDTWTDQDPWETR